MDTLNKTLDSFGIVSETIGKYCKPVLYSLGIVIIVCLLARAVLAKSPSPQQLALQDAPVQQQIVEDTQEATDRNAVARLKLAQDIACGQDASQCPLTPGTPSAE